MIKLFEFASRDEAHRQLERSLKMHPGAECREDPNAAQPYQVWSAGEVRNTAAISPHVQPGAKDPLADLNDDDRAQLRKLLALIKAGE